MDFFNITQIPSRFEQSILILFYLIILLLFYLDRKKGEIPGIKDVLKYDSGNL